MFMIVITSNGYEGTDETIIIACNNYHVDRFIRQFTGLVIVTAAILFTRSTSQR